MTDTNWIEEYRAEKYPISLQYQELEGKRSHRVVVGEPQFAGAIALVKKPNGDVLLVQQYRASLNRTLWELPRGMAEPNEDVIETARRELLEETGYTVHNGEFLGFTYPDSGVLSSHVAVVTFSLPESAEPEGEPDGEVDNQEWFNAEQLRELIVAGELRDSMSLAALVLESTKK